MKDELTGHQMATKNDIALLRTEWSADFAQQRADFSSELSALERHLSTLMVMSYSVLAVIIASLLIFLR